MKNSQKFQTEIGGRKLEVEISNLAERANGNVFIRYGDTSILVTSVMSKYLKEDQDFFPLTVDYEERFYAAGKIGGSRYIRREGRPSDEAILNSRLIDRAIRPRFPKNLKNEVQIVATCLSYDLQNDPDVLALLGASLALSISDIPWSGPLASLRIGKRHVENKQKNNHSEFILNPTSEQREEPQLDLVLAAIGSAKDDILINMIEGQANEAEEELILEAVEWARPHLKKLLEFQNQIIKKVGRAKIILEPPSPETEIEQEIQKLFHQRLAEALLKNHDTEKIDILKDELSALITEKYPGKTNYALNFFEEEINRILHQNILEKEARPDGRKLDQIREVSVEVGILPRTHGSALFCRGLTKALSILTLGAPGDVQLLEGMEIVGKKRFMHHYNFPPYSSGEIKPMRGPGRREIGHGTLVEKALLPLIPSIDEFPYTIRVVSEIISSNGSTSMASVSSSSLALMDAGVPIRTAATGIALGLIQDSESKNYKILTDIQGPEDHYGDMDFKIAGTKQGITAMQMDVKVEGITLEILKKVLSQGKKARLQILDKMNGVISRPRAELSVWAPKIYTIQIKPEKIREVIGPGGKVIHEITEKCEVVIDIEESGKVYITAEKEEAAKKAMSWIKNITKEVRVGETFQGRVKRILEFGAFVEILPGQEGLVHISKLSPHRVERVQDVVRIGDTVSVKVISIDEQGRINLSMK